MGDENPSPAPRADFEPGACVAQRFRLVRKIASGGMAVVWLASTETGKLVAVKLIKTDRLTSDGLRRMRKEARVTSALRHPNIVTMLEFVDGPEMAIVLEYLRGETLETYLERCGPRPIGEALAILLPILDALGHAHEHGVTHRDLKPSNIFLARTSDGHIVPTLLDFGICRSVDTTGTGTAADRTVGTPAYMAPEQVYRKPIDQRADIFAFGVVLNEVLTGRRPFPSPDDFEQPDPDPSLDGRLWLELRRAIARYPYERHRNASELAGALRAIAAPDDALQIEVRTGKEEPDAARESGHWSFNSTSTPLPKRSSQSTTGAGQRAWLLPLAVLMIAQLIVVAFFLRSAQPSPPPLLMPAPTSPRLEASAPTMEASPPAPPTSDAPPVPRPPATKPHVKKRFCGQLCDPGF